METKRKSFLSRAAMTLLVTLLLTMTAQTAWAQYNLTDPSDGTIDGTSITWSFASGTLTISGTGAIPDYTWWHESSPSPFNRYNNITTVTFGEGITHIGSHTIDCCAHVTTINIPSTVTSMGEQPFGGCNELATINVAAGNTAYATDGGLLYNAEKTSLLLCPKAISGTVTIPGTVTSISSSALSGVTGMTALDLSACTSLTTISASLCYGCTNLQTVTLPASIEVIGQMAFQNCSSLSTINLNACTKLSEISGQAFSGCGALAGPYTLPSSLTSVESFAFMNCTSLTQLTFSATSLTTYGSTAFEGCTNLTLVLPTTMLQTIMADTDNNWHEYIYKMQLPSGYTGFTLSLGTYLHTVAATLDGSGNTTVAIPTNVKVNYLILPRTFNKDQVSTWMMPFPSKVGTFSLNFYTFTGVVYNNTTNKWEANMTQLSVGDAVAANTPYIVKAGNYYEIYNESGSLTDFTLNTSTNSRQTTVGDWTFRGVYTQKIWTSSDVGKDYGFAATDGIGVTAGDFVKLVANAYCQPMRCYLTYTGGGNPFAAPANRAGAELPQTISVVLKNADGSTTEIGTITPAFTEGEQVWYSLDGMRLNEKPATKGVYINNGKKIVIK